MPRKKPPSTRVKVGEASPLSPPNRNTATDFDRVRHALFDIDELACLPKKDRENLVDDIVAAVGHHRAGLDMRKHGVSNQAVAKGVFLADVGRALQRAGQKAKRWRKIYDGGENESLWYQVAREVGEVCGIDLPSDMKRLGKIAVEIEHNSSLGRFPAPHG